MVKIEVGSTYTTYGPEGEVVSEVTRPSYLILEDGTKKELTKEEALAYGIGRDE